MGDVTSRCQRVHSSGIYEDDSCNSPNKSGTDSSAHLISAEKKSETNSSSTGNQSISSNYKSTSLESQKLDAENHNATDDHHIKDIHQINRRIIERDPRVRTSLRDPDERQRQEGSDMSERSPARMRDDETRRSTRSANFNPNIPASLRTPIRNNSTGSSSLAERKDHSNSRSGSSSSKSSVKSAEAGSRTNDHGNEGQGGAPVKRNSASGVIEGSSISVRQSEDNCSRTSRRSSIAVLPVVTSLGSHNQTPPPFSAASLKPPWADPPQLSPHPPVSPMDRVNMSLSSASDLVSSLIGAASGASHPKQSTTETSFWVPPGVWRKKRAHSLIPQKHSNDGSDNKGSAALPGYKKAPSLSNSLQEMSLSDGNGSDEAAPSNPDFPGFPPVSASAGVPASCQDYGNDGQKMLRKRRASMQDAIDLTKFNASLYERPPLVSHKMFGSIQEENCGSLNLSVGFEPEGSLLTVRIIRAQDLVPPDGRASVDPYCRLSLLPHKGAAQFQSRVIKNSLCPDFEEDFVFDVEGPTLEERILEVILLDAGGSGEIGREDILGQILLPLEELHLNKRLWLWKGISPYIKQREVESWGDIMFSVTYLSSAERLTVVVTKARHLKSVDELKSNTANPFVRVSLLSGGKRIKKKRTTTKRNTTTPCWNEALVFNVHGLDSLTAVKLELTVFNDNLLGSNEAMGRLMVGEHSPHDDLAHWLSSLSSRAAPSRWHPLLPPEPNT